MQEIIKLVLKLSLSISLSIILLSLSFLVVQYSRYIGITIRERIINIAIIENERYSPRIEEPKEEDVPYINTEFDLRIANLKEELIRKNFPGSERLKSSTKADIGHEGIYNIPHDEVKSSYGVGDNYEISE